MGAGFAGEEVRRTSSSSTQSPGAAHSHGLDCEPHSHRFQQRFQTSEFRVAAGRKCPVAVQTACGAKVQHTGGLEVSKTEIGACRMGTRLRYLFRGR